jgi:hypothetical protein
METHHHPLSSSLAFCPLGHSIDVVVMTPGSIDDGGGAK